MTCNERHSQRAYRFPQDSLLSTYVSKSEERPPILLDPATGMSHYTDDRYNGRAFTRISSLQAAKLTRRELEVLQLVAAGLSNAEIAERLVLTLATVISYLNTVYKKLGVCSRTAAMRYAIDHLSPYMLPAEKLLPEEGEVNTKLTHCKLSLTRVAKLTRRELEVLQLVAAGLSNAEIAERLVLTLATVISYLNTVYKKLGVCSRTAAMRYAIDHFLC